MKINQILGRLLAVVSAAVMVAVPAQATLVGRDINGLAVAGSSAGAVFLYDTTLNITWLRNANVNGLMNWGQANTWAAGYSLGSYSGWRLPTMVDTGTSGCNFSYAGGTDCGYNVQTTSGSTVYSEMASLFYDTLGNKAYCPPGNATCIGPGVPQTSWGLTNVGDFLNMQSNFYWSGTEYAPGPGGAWGFDTGNGGQDANDKNIPFYAMAVRPGDVLAAQVPEPESLVLALTALGAMALVRRRRALGSSAL